ncbi:MAG: PilZ domain-containing protein [Proteobacteria bacterium]|nr:PilZ domain-containing protein [Pseudomonadota bacterium]
MVLDTVAPSADPIIARIEPDRRRHKRVPLTLLGRFMRANKQEYPCKLIDISVGGASFMSPVPVADGEAIVVYLDQLGGLEGSVARQFSGGFAIAFSHTQHRREKLAAQLTWLINRTELDGADARQHERVVPRNPSSTLTLDDEATSACQVIDVSISGASIATALRPAIGSEVRIGKLRSRVVRHHPQGIAVRFMDIQQPMALRRYFG